MLTRAMAVLLMIVLTGCEIVPGTGPLAWTVRSEQTGENHERNYHIIAVNDALVARLASFGHPSLGGRFGNRQAPPVQTLAVGDALSITIFESAPNGLFSSGAEGDFSGARQVVLPTQVVDQSGFIQVPFGGRFRAAGNTNRALSGTIERALSDRAIEPQVLITTVESTSNTATVLGKVSSTGPVDLSPRGERLLSVLGKAGIQAEESEAVIRLVRDGQIETVPLRTIINVPSENIYVLPGDILFVLSEPQVFNALGAVQSPGQYSITFADQTVAGALSLAGGLSDAIANRGGVFIFRFESVETARRLLPPEVTPRVTPMGVPIVYQISFLDPNSFFWLQQMQIRNGDLIYVAQAVVSELDEFIALAARGQLLGL